MKASMTVSSTHLGEKQASVSLHQHRPRASPLQQRLHGSLLALGLAVVLTVTGCSPSPDYESDLRGPSIPAGDDTPFEQRQSLEDYVATIVPVILEFEDRVTQAGSGEWRSNQALPSQFDVTPCLGESAAPGSGRFELSTIGTGALPTETVQQLGEELFVPLGFQTEITEDAYGNHELTWTDWKNGGQLRSFIGQRVVTLAGFSECRPSDDWEQVRTEVQELDPLRDGPVSRPSSPDPTPSRTRSLPRSAHRRAVSAPVKEPA